MGLDEGEGINCFNWCSEAFHRVFHFSLAQAREDMMPISTFAIEFILNDSGGLLFSLVLSSGLVISFSLK